MSVRVLTANDFLSALRAASEWLDANKQEVDALNVFPVPDGDTGTNMSLTLKSAVREAEKAPLTSMTKVAEAAAMGSLMGARGNSGVILSQLLRGFASGVAGRDTINATTLAQALGAAANRAYQAVMKPVEGTILTVARAVARFALDESRRNDDIVALLEGCRYQGQVTLDKTPQMLAVLKEAGVVDAGGKGLVFIIEGALQYFHGSSHAGAGRQTAEPPAVTSAAGARVAPPPQQTAGLGRVSEETMAESLQHRYCTEFLVRGRERRLDLDEMRRHLAAVDGSSLLVVGEDTLAKIHIHTNDPGQILSYCAPMGDLLEVQIHNMADQAEAREELLDSIDGSTGALMGAADAAIAGPAGAVAADRITADRIATDRVAADSVVADAIAASAGVATKSAGAKGELGVVAVAIGDGLKALFENLGADAVVQGGQTMNPSTQELLDAVESLAQPRVVILPNNGNVILTANQVRELTTRQVDVLSTKTIPQGLATLVAFDVSRSAADNLKSMSQAMTGVRTGEVTYAVRNSKLNGLSIAERDIIGLGDGEIRAVGATPAEVVEDLVKTMVDEGTEIITLYYGVDVSAEDARELGTRLAGAYPDCEVEVHHGGQPVYYYIVSCE